MKSSFTIVALAALSTLGATTLAAPSFAQDKATCLEAHASGQALRNDHKLLAARDKLRVCAQRSCPGAIATDCATWLEELEKSIPTVVLAARDDAGKDLMDTMVAIDGGRPEIKLDGRSMPLDPGPHTFVFTLGGARTEQRILLNEGQKNLPVIGLMSSAKPAPAPPPPQPAPPPSQRSAEPARGNAAEPKATGAAPGNGSPRRTVGFIVGGVGIAGLGVGTVFGIMAASAKGGAHCDASNACDAGPLSDAKKFAVVSDVGLIAGGVLLLGGAVLVFTAPSPSGTGALRLSPSIASRSQGITLEGSF
jgi:hypothetical protein